jgi:hypothetical protein
MSVIPAQQSAARTPFHSRTSRVATRTPSGNEMSENNHSCICEKPLRKYSNVDREIHNWNCPQDSACGIECHKHFEQRNAKKWEVEECEDCQNARKKEAERIQREHTIDPEQPYGQHIALTCKNHPELRWSTKNIDYIGARSIFYFSENVAECSCSANLLMVVK